MMFDLSQCLNPAVLVSGCSTPQVNYLQRPQLQERDHPVQICVKECPKENYLGLGADKLIGIGGGEESDKEKMKPYCKKIDEGKFQEFSVKELIANEICPPWYLKSTEILGRCFPTGNLS